ncbi:MAG: tetratricopeptide repeat protein [Desulfovibrio sp.]|nr:tetratricopeptide repeat protein [Desulfovibrio sp.]
MLENSDLQTLGEIGFCAVLSGNILQARTIFEGLLAARPGHPAPRMGIAMSHYMIDEFDQAESVLRSLLDEKPDYHLARVHLALCLILAGRGGEAVPLLREAERVNDPLFKDMVAELLEHAA